MTTSISDAALAPEPLYAIPFPAELPQEDGLSWRIENGVFVWTDAPVATLDDIDYLKETKIDIPSIPASDNSDYLAADGTYKSIPPTLVATGIDGAIMCQKGDFFQANESFVIVDGRVVAESKDAGIDSVIVLRNTSQQKSSCAAIQWNYVKPTGEEYVAGVMGFRDWAPSPNFGEWFVRVGAHNSINSDTLTLDPNGFLRAPCIVSKSSITAGTTNPTGFVYHVGADNTVPGLGLLRHGAWSKDHYAIIFRGAGHDYGCATWQQLVGIGTTSWNNVKAKFHVINHSDDQPTHIDEGFEDQTKDIYQANPHGSIPGAQFSIDCSGIPTIPVFTANDRPNPNPDGRVRMIWNSDTGMVNFDNGSNWVLADGTVV